MVPVRGAIPVTGLPAATPSEPPPGGPAIGASNSNWEQKFQGAGWVFEDISFPGSLGNLDLFVANTNGQSVEEHNGRTGALVNTFPAPGDYLIDVTFGPDNNFYATSLLGNRVLRFDGSTGALLGTFASGGGLSNAYSLTFGPDGNLYVSSRDSGQILRYSGTTGAFLGVFAACGDMTAPQGLTFGPNGDLYVADNAVGVVRFDGTTGAFISDFTGPINIDSLTFGPDGNLYVSRIGGSIEQAGTIERYNGATGSFIDTLVTHGSGGLATPSGLSFGPDGNLYVASEHGGGGDQDSVLRYDGTSGAFLDTFASNLRNPGGMVFHAPLASQTGFAVAELGKVLRTRDGGNTWNTVLNLGFPYYWYGVHAFNAQRAVISGFNNQTGDGVLRWTYDGGQTWSGDIILTGNPDFIRWLDQIAFVDDVHGIAMAAWSGGDHVTADGGATATDWSYVQADPSHGWIFGNFTYWPDGNVWAAGISFCHSSDHGQTWVCRPSIDPVFDGGGVTFPDVTHGWVAGGEIAPEVRGWVHRTVDGGQTWSGRILDAPFPIRSTLFLNDSIGFAVGGDIYAGVGGIYSTIDGGDTWNLDIATGAEMKSIKAIQTSPHTVTLWCVGFTPEFTGKIFKTEVTLP
jgi:photosystem II stability/assembly factor-like uncharacterized protein